MTKQENFRLPCLGETGVQGLLLADGGDRHPPVVVGRVDEVVIVQAENLLPGENVIKLFSSIIYKCL